MRRHPESGTGRGMSVGSMLDSGVGSSEERLGRLLEPLPLSLIGFPMCSFVYSVSFKIFQEPRKVTCQCNKEPGFHEAGQKRNSHLYVRLGTLCFRLPEAPGLRRGTPPVAPGELSHLEDRVVKRNKTHTHTSHASIFGTLWGNLWLK